MMMTFDYIVIYDRHGVRLTKDETDEFLEDVWDAGIPPCTAELLIALKTKWGERMDIP